MLLYPTDESAKVLTLPEDELSPDMIAQLRAEYQKKVEAITPENVHEAVLQGGAIGNEWPL